MHTLVREVRTSHDVGAVLFGRARRLILGWLLGHPDETYFLRQLVRQTGLSPGSVQRELAALVSAGLVTRTTQGRQVYFQADTESPVFTDLRSLFLKTAGVADVLRDGLRPLTDRIVAAFVFGSAARSELRNASDIDVLVVGDVSFADVVGGLSEAQRVLGREVNPTVYPPAEFRQKIRDGHHFLTSVLDQPHIFLIGDRDELGRLGAQKQMAHGPQDDKAGNRRSAGGRRARPAGKRH
jgi:predicted nucleotidyltransferase